MGQPLEIYLIETDFGKTSEAYFDDVRLEAVDIAPPICVLNLDLTHATGTLTMDFELGTLDPAMWDVRLISVFGLTSLWTLPVPAVDPPESFPVAFPFPSIGSIGILTTLTTVDGVVCGDFKIVDTGGLGATLEELEGVLDQNGILRQGTSP